MSPSRSSCGACGASVVWVKTEASGSQMPLDPEPVADGNVILVEQPQSRHKVARVLSNDRLPAPAPAYRSHFATCPDAAAQRRAKAGKRTSRCGLCSWSLVGTNAKKLQAAHAQHYATEHLDRCEACRAPLRWIRDEGDLRILALDPEPVVGGRFVVVEGVDQQLARAVAPSAALALAVHSCPEGSPRG